MEAAFASAVLPPGRPRPAGDAVRSLGNASAGGQGKIFVAGADGILRAVDARFSQDADKLEGSVQTVKLDPPVKGDITQIEVSPGCVYAALAGPGVGLVVAELPDGGASAKTCRAVPLGGDLFAMRSSLRVLQMAWHPMASGYLGVLTSDGVMRLFNAVARPEEAEQEFVLLPDGCSAGHGRPVAFSFSEGGFGWEPFTVRLLFDSGSAFVLCPVVPFGARVQGEALDELLAETPEEDGATAAWLQQAFAGAPRGGAGGVAGGTRRARPHAMESASPALQGPLPATPPISLLAGERATSLAVVPAGVGATVVAIATGAGRVLAALQAGDSRPSWRAEAPRGRWSEGGSGALESVSIAALPSPPPPGLSLLVIDDVDLELSPAARAAGPVALVPDRASPEVLYCAHGGGAHALTLVWLPALARWLELRAAGGGEGGGRPELAPPHVEQLLDAPPPPAGGGGGPGVLGAVSLGDSLAEGALVCVTSAGAARVLRPSGAAAAAAAAAAVAVAAAEAGAPAGGGWGGEGGGGGDVAPEDGGGAAAALYKDLLAGPKAAALPQISGPLGSATPEGRQYFHGAKEALRAGHVAHAKRAHGDLMQRARALGDEAERQAERQAEVRAGLDEARARAEATARRIERARAVHKNLHARLQLLADLEASRRRPLSDAEVSFQREVAEHSENLPVLKGKSEELHARAKRLVAASAAAAGDGGAGGAPSPGGRMGTPGPRGTPGRRGVPMVGGLSAGTPIVGGAASSPAARGRSPGGGLTPGRSPGPAGGLAQMRELQGALRAAEEAIERNISNLRRLDACSAGGGGLNK